MSLKHTLIDAIHNNEENTMNGHDYLQPDWFQFRRGREIWISANDAGNYTYEVKSLSTEELDALGDRLVSVTGSHLINGGILLEVSA